MKSRISEAFSAYLLQLDMAGLFGNQIYFWKQTKFLKLADFV